MLSNMLFSGRGVMTTGKAENRAATFAKDIQDDITTSAVIM